MRKTIPVESSLTGHKHKQRSACYAPATPRQANSQTCAVELLRWVATTVRDKRAGDVFARWYDAQGQVSATYTFEGLWTEAGRIAHQLRVAWGLSKGDRVVLCFGFGLDFFAAFLGCLRAGVLAVPVCEWGWCQLAREDLTNRCNIFTNLFSLVMCAFCVG